MTLQKMIVVGVEGFAFRDVPKSVPRIETRPQRRWKIAIQRLHAHGKYSNLRLLLLFYTKGNSISYYCKWLPWSYNFIGLSNSK